jgi:adenine-specific DNA-methyltransferase
MTKSVINPPPAPAITLLHELRRLIPGAFADGELNWASLHAALGGESVQDQRYLFTWVGKADAMRLMQVSSRGGLHPRPEKSTAWDVSKHVFIDGENLEVLKLLYTAYFGQVRLVCIAPPYNSDGDPIYVDDYADPLAPYLKVIRESDQRVLPLKASASTDARHHSSWLSMMYPRLALARQLLTEDGFLAVNIDDVEQYHVRLLLNEIFGAENYVATLVWDRSRKNDAKLFSVGHDYVVVYARNASHLRDTDLVLRAPKEGLDEVKGLWDSLRTEHGDNFEEIGKHIRAFLRAIPDDDPRAPMKRFRKVDAGGPYRDDADLSWHGGGGPRYDVPHPTTGKPCAVPSRGWVYPTPERMNEEIAKGNIVFGPDETTIPSRKSRLFEKNEQVMSTVHYSYSQTAARDFREVFDGASVFENPKHWTDIRSLVEYLTDEDDLILDFFAGPATTGHAVLDSNWRSKSRRRFVLVQLQEPVESATKAGKAARALGLNNLAEIGRERLRRVIEKRGSAPDAEADSPADLGFRVFELGESCFLPWPNEPIEDHNLDMFLDRVRSGTDPMAIVWELALREGYPLSAQIDEVAALGSRVYRIYDERRTKSVFICLSGDITADLPDALVMEHDEVLICADKQLTDESAANLALRCRLKTF